MDQVDFQLEVFKNGQYDSNITGEVAIVGSPYHESKTNLIERYIESPSNYYEFESTHSCGSYFLVDLREDPVVIMSPSAIGGYIVTHGDKISVNIRLSDALAHIPFAELSMDESQFIHYSFSKPLMQMPFSTLFEDIERLPPGVVLTINEDGFDRWSYLSASSSAKNYREVLDETGSTIADQNVVVALSGGVDSTAIACSLVDHGANVRAVTFDIGPGHDSEIVRGEYVAEQLGIDHKTVTVPSPTDGTLVDRIEAAMDQDLLSFSHDRLGFLKTGAADNEIVVSGQSMDVMSQLRMRNTGGFDISAKSLIKLKRIGELLLNHIGHNIMFTEPYMTRDIPRKIYIRSADTLYPLLHSYKNKVKVNGFGKQGYELTVEPPVESVLKGVLSTYKPNIVFKTPDRLIIDRDTAGADQLDIGNSYDLFEQHHQLSYLHDEIKKFDSIDPYGVQPRSESIKRLLFYGFSQHIQKTPSSYISTNNTQIEAPVTWAPSLSFFFNKKHGVKSAFNPKQEVYQAVESYLGYSYNDISVPQHSGGWNCAKESKLVERNKQYLSPEESHVLEIISSENDLIPCLYRDVRRFADRNEINSRNELMFLQGLINIERLLYNVYQ